MMATHQSSGSLVKVDQWSTLAKNHQVDPYAVWCLQTGFRALRQSDGGNKKNKLPSVLNFVVELQQPYEPYKSYGSEEPFEPQPFAQSDTARVIKSLLIQNLATPLSDPPRGMPRRLTKNITLDVPPAYTAQFNKVRPKFITLRMTCQDASEEEVNKAVQGLVVNMLVKRLQIGFPRGSNNPDHEPAQPPASSDCKASLVLGVLEDSIPFAHGALREKGSAEKATRVQAIWDQSTLRLNSQSWRPGHQFSYGQQMTKAAMDEMLLRHHDGAAVDEDAVYADSLVEIPKLGLRASHGAAVLPLLAGEWHAAPGMPQRADPDGGSVLDVRPVHDKAAQAPIIAVQLPQEQITVSSGRWLAVNALDGLHYIVEEARRMSSSGESPPSLVVNMSYGAIAGPHDGSGMLECAIDELTQLYASSGGDMAVVLAAGNTNGCLRNVDDDGRRVASGIHAKASISAGNSKTFTLFIPPDKQFETYVEIWFDRVVDFDKDDKQVKIVVTPPYGEPWDAVFCTETSFWPDTSATQAGLLFYPRVSQGNNRSMALLVVAATQVNSRLIYAPSGHWQIQVTHLSSPSAPQDFLVEAWVERDDTMVGARRPQSARFVDIEGDADAVAPSDVNTFASIATGRSVFTAGALLDRGAGVEEDISPYSAAGSTPEKGPQFSAIVDAGYALSGIRVSGSQSGMVVRANGTSMAAPQSARWLANVLGLAQELDQRLTSSVMKAVIETFPPSVDGRRGRFMVDASDQAVDVSEARVEGSAFVKQDSTPLL